MKNFSEIYGHEKIKEHLQNAIKLKKVSHAYIFNGGLGSGKKSLAELFAKTLQCEENMIEPCGKCHSCIQSESGNQPDIIWVRHEKSGSIGVNEIREQLVGDIQIKPYSSRYKIYIIDEAEKLTVAAQNAMLKTIEEPPEYGIIILLTTNADIFLQTISSRCVRLDFRPVRDEIVEEYLRKHYDLNTYQIRFATAFAQGNIGRAIDIVTSDEFSAIKKDVLDMIKNARNSDTVEVMDLVKDISVYRQKINDYLDLCTMWFRDVLLFKSTNDTNNIIFKDEISLIKEQATSCSYEGIDDIINAADRAKIRLKANVNFDLVMELYILTIRENL